jgi:hypothetical protein
MADVSFELDQMTPELRQLLGRALQLREHSQERLGFNFTLLLLAFLVAEDPISRWFQGYVRERDVGVDDMLGSQGIDRTRLEALAGEPSPEIQELPQALPQEISTSAEGMLNQAWDLRHATSREVVASSSARGAPPRLDVRHVMGAYIYRPSGHEKQLQGWGLEREAWSNAFLAQIQRLHPDEFERWVDEHRTTFSSDPALEPVVEGLSTHIAGDRWTTDDALGYDAYAYAIYKFIRDDETQIPLTISVQAPWGGGKTSLMRMVQKRLDPEALRPYDGPTRDEGERAETVEGGDGEPGRLTMGRVRTELQQLIRGEPPTFELAEDEAKGMQSLTIWFNAWKYESTEQVWAGLADAIIRQFAGRLRPLHRELFWLHLHLQRLDVDKIRQAVYDRLLSFWWKQAYPWIVGAAVVLVVFLALTVILWTGASTWLRGLGLGGTLGSLLVGAGQAIAKYRQVVDEPAEVTLSEYVRAPDYSAKLGFVHYVQEDLQRVFREIDEAYCPVVIFVDDLDRCSPDKVADVVEAINLFLAGEFPNCIFVLAMDPDMVAAALEEAHAKVIAKLPADVSSTPIGWRFMDKFVQLPFVIPPADPQDLQDYARSLLSERRRHRDRDPAIQAALNDVLQAAEAPSQVRQAVERAAQEHGLDEDQQYEVRVRAEHEEERRVIDRGIERFSDRDSEVRRIVLDTAPDFSHNPRELKRFLNLYRFLYFLTWARKGRGRDAPSEDQLRRWIVLSLKWPEVVRWIRRSYGGREAGRPEFRRPSRLKQLEEFGASSQDQAAWQAAITARFRLTVDKAPWIADDGLRQFFKTESGLEESARLSTAEGNGLW